MQHHKAWVDDKEESALSIVPFHPRRLRERWMAYGIYQHTLQSSGSDDKTAVRGEAMGLRSNALTLFTWLSVLGRMEQGFASPSKCLVEWGAIPRFAQGMRALQLNLEALGFCIFIFMFKRKSIGFRSPIWWSFVLAHGQSKLWTIWLVGSVLVPSRYLW